MTTPKKKTAKKAAPSAPQTVEESTPVSEWKKPIPATPLPSGKAIKLRNATFQTFMRLGMIPNSLLAVVQKSIDKGKAPELNELVETPKQIEDMVAMVDSVVCFVAIDPKIHPVPMKRGEDNKLVEDTDARREDLLYVDEVDDEDKMFIFGVCTGGTRDVERFRSEQANSLAAL